MWERDDSRIEREKYVYPSVFISTGELYDHLLRD